MIRRIFLPTAFFLSVLFIGDRLGGDLLDRATMRTKFRYPQLYSGELPADIVVLGNSRALHMFHPPAIEQVTDLRTVSLSFNGLPTVAMPALWEDYLDQHEAPLQLILEVSCVGRADDDGSLERFTTLMAHSPRISQVLADHNLTEYWSSKLSHLYRYNSELMWRSLFFLGKSDQDWIMQGTATKPQLQRIMSQGIEPLIRSSGHIDAFRSIISTANQHDVEVVLILAPYHPDYLPALEQLPEWYSWIQSELGLPIHDYRDAVTDDASFADHIHLNQGGAKQLASVLEQDGILASPTPYSP